MNFDKSLIEFSRHDKNRQITLPNNITPELSELTGIMIGDGNIYMKNQRYEIAIVGDAKEDLTYHKQHIKNIFKKCFNIEPIVKIRHFKDGRKCIASKIESKALCLFFTNCLNLPNGKKKNIRISDHIVQNDKNIIHKFLRGIADTDFSIRFKTRQGKKNYYPLIIGQFSDELLVQYLKALLAKIDIHSHIEKTKSKIKGRDNIYLGYRIVITGIKNFNKWMIEIGFANERHLTKYKVWKKTGYCPPYTNIEKRKTILDKAEDGN